MQEEQKQKKQNSGEMHGGYRSREGKKEGREKRGSKPLLVTEISDKRGREGKKEGREKRGSKPLLVTEISDKREGEIKREGK